MSFNVTKVADYVKPISRELATKAISDATTAKLLIANGRLQTGIKGSMAILQMDADVNIQAAGNCSARNPVGGVNLFNKEITVARLKDQQNFCQDILINSYFAELIAKGQNPETETLDASFVNTFMGRRAAKIAYENEKLMWHGDTSLLSSNPLHFINGFIKQSDTGVDLSVVTGATIVEKLQAAYLAMPVEIRTKPDFRLFIGEDMFADYTIALANKNIFKPTEDMTLFGTTVKLEPTSGLNGSNAVYAARLSNMLLGVDGDGDADYATLRYSMEYDVFYGDFHWALGVAVIYPTETGYGVIA